MRPKLLMLLYLIGVSLGLYLAFSHWSYDDPYITYRYAENIRHGLGFVYNPGEQVLSTTTPLFALLLAGLGFLGLELSHLANGIGAISLAAGGLGLWALGRSWKLPWLSWTGLLLYPTFALLLNTLGSETPLYLTLGIWAFALYAGHQYGGAVLLSALAILTRSDGVLIPALIGLDYAWRNRNRLGQATFWRQQPWVSVGVALAILLGWHIFAWVYFGSPFPITLAAKQNQGAMLISTRFAPGLLRVVSWYVRRWQYWLELSLVLIGIIGVFWRQRPALLFLSWAALYFLAYTALGVSSYFWYYAPLVPGWVLGVGLGISGLAALPIWKIPRVPEKTRTVVIGILLAALFAAQLHHLSLLRHSPDQRYPIYRAAGEWIAANTDADVRVGALEVGIIGYYAQRKMLDFAGLIQPQVAQQLGETTTYEDAALWAVDTYRPEIVLLFEGDFPRLQSGYLAEFCHLEHRFPGEDYQFQATLEVFACSP